MATHAPRSKAHDTLTPDELAALIASAERAGGWRALARGWEALGATTLQRLARGASATPTVLFTVRAQLASMTAPPTPPRLLRSVPTAGGERRTMSDEWQGWSREFPSREAVEAHVAASPPPPYASAWATGAPWMRVGGCGDLSVIYLAIVDGEVRARFGGDAAWHALEFGRVGRWRPITALGEETAARAAEPILEALDAAAVRLARECNEAQAQLRGAKATIAELLRADEGERAVREERWSRHLADIERLTAERDAARAIIDGRTTPPTDAEIAAHDGPWLVVEDHAAGYTTHVVSDDDARALAARQLAWPKFRAWVWHPFCEARGVIEPWPVVEGER